MLITYGANRVMLDVRPRVLDPLPMAMQVSLTLSRKKPKLPLHVLSTAEQPIIRFIGHIDKAINTRYFKPWVDRLALWISQGKTPFLICAYSR